MTNYELITAEDADRLEVVGDELADAYKVAFAGPPWNEVSRCITLACDESFSKNEPGCDCVACGSKLVEAYDSEVLIANWQRMLKEEDAVMEISFQDDLPIRATIARPTDAAELFERKYQSSPVMKAWLEGRLSGQFVWIEDTFANREVVPTGNLKDRGQTLRRVADFYGGLQIVTRTLSPAIVSATLRDVATRTAVYIGTEGVGRARLNQVTNNPGYELPTVPDARTLLSIRAGVKENR